MRYLSVCSGIEAATVAWHPLGWTPAAFSEIEPFPCKVLAHHYPNTPNLGDMTKFKEWPDYDDINLLVGGTPCQSFSVAGLRKGLDDPRGNLMLTYLAIADKYKPRYLCWENVPGVLSSNGGRDFGTFLGAMEKLGYGFAYRVLDAQFVRTDGYPYAVPQRRRRVFVVGCLGDWGRAAAVLFDSESLRGNPPPRREAGQAVAGTVTNGTCSGKPTFGTLMANCGQKLWLGNQEALSGDYHVFDTQKPIALVGNTIGRQPHNGGNGTGFDASGTMYTLTKTDVHAVAFDCSSLGGGWAPQNVNASEEYASTLNCTNQKAVAFGVGMQVSRLTPHDNPDSMHDIKLPGGENDELVNGASKGTRCLSERDMRSMQCGEIRSASQERGLDGSSHRESAKTVPKLPHESAPEDAGVCDMRGQAQGSRVLRNALPEIQNTRRPDEVGVPREEALQDGELQSAEPCAGVLQQTCAAIAPGNTRSGSKDKERMRENAMAVRRLTPTECHRLQGFSDGYLNQVPGASDTQMYKALGNSMAVNVMQLIGERIQYVERLLP